MSEIEDDRQMECRRCDRRAVFVTPSGYLCSTHALDDMRTDPDWVPLIRTDLERQTKTHQKDS